MREPHVVKFELVLKPVGSRYVSLHQMEKAGNALAERLKIAGGKLAVSDLRLDPDRAVIIVDVIKPDTWSVDETTVFMEETWHSISGWWPVAVS